MSMKEAIIHVLRNYANFSGRARRSEYWYFVLFTSLAVGVLAGLSTFFFGENSTHNIFTVLSSLFSLAVFIPNLAVTWRRLHDIGKSGANYLWVLLPVIGGIMVLIWTLKDSQPGDNQYGPNPKETYYY